MKKTIILAFTVAVFNCSFAQEDKDTEHPGKPPHKEGQAKKQKTSEERAQQQANQLEKIVGLTPEQKAKVYEASLKKFKTIKEAKEKHKADTDKKILGQEIKAARNTYKSELNIILTPEQQAKLKQHHEEAKAKHEAKKAEMKRKHEEHGQGKKPAIKEGDDKPSNDNAEDEGAGEDEETEE